MANVFYNRMIRKLTVAFGDLFNNITLVRYNPDLTEQERFIVPIDYAAKELYVICLLYTSPSPRDRTRSRMPSSA